MEQKTALYDRHVACGGKIVSFAGYLLPVQYSGVIAEHMAVRTKAGLFDVSHMGEVVFEGPDALANINYLLANDFANLAIGRVRYSPMCNMSGGVVDDLIVYRTGETCYYVVVNAANRHKDVAWIQQHLFGDVQFTDISDQVAQIALQGPESEAILRKVAEEPCVPKKYYSFVDMGSVAGVICMVSRTGYTGESGFELYCRPEDAATLWDVLMDAGKDNGLIPCGLGARDTLRLEAAMPLYGHEMDEDISPLEAGLDFGVKMNKPDFIGKSGIAKRLPLTRKRVGLKVTGRGIVREECPVYLTEKEIGKTTSGTHCPYLGYPVAMALVSAAHTEPGTQVEVEVRGRKVAAEIVELPFYKKA